MRRRADVSSGGTWGGGRGHRSVFSPRRRARAGALRLTSGAGGFAPETSATVRSFVQRLLRGAGAPTDGTTPRRPRGGGSSARVGECGRPAGARDERGRVAKRQVRGGAPSRCRAERAAAAERGCLRAPIRFFGQTVVRAHFGCR